MRPKKPKKTRMTPEEASMAGAEWAMWWCGWVLTASDTARSIPFDEKLRRQLCTITPTRRGDFESSAKAILKLRYDQLREDGVPEHLFVAWEDLPRYDWNPSNGKWTQITPTAGYPTP